jgi:serine protease Do
MFSVYYHKVITFQRIILTIEQRTRQTDAEQQRFSIERKILMYEREQDMMKNESNNTAASEPKQPESTVTNQNPYSTSAATGSTTANHTAETNSTASGTIYGAANRYGSTTPTGYGYTTNSSTNQSTGYTGNTSSDTQSQQQGYSYVNYYSNPNAPVQASGSGKPPKKKNHFWMKAVAFVAAMAIVSVGSIGIYNGVHNSNKLVTAESSTSASDSTDTTANTTTQDSSSKAQSTTVKGDAAKSWIELASGTNAMSISDIVKKVAPSVVGVQATFKMPNNYNYNYGFGMFGNGNSGNGDNSGSMTGVGTGIIMREDGYIVTNAHVIYDSEYGCGEATAVEIRMSDEETTYDAKVVAYDIETDLAVLKVDQTGLTAAEFGNSNQCQVGDAVVAIGNPLGLELQNTVTCGIISALNRKVTINDKTMTLIQTDTAINNGNSGGPLINSSGQVIGINSAKMSSSVSSSGATIEGIGFAIPMTEAREIVDDLINYGYVTGRPQLGISCQDVSEAVSQAYNLPIGAYVISVTDGGAAAEAGLQVGDVITAINDNKIETTEELNNYKNEYNAGDTVTLTIVRNGQEQKVSVVLQEVQQKKQS